MAGQAAWRCAIMAERFFGEPWRQNERLWRDAQRRAREFTPRPPSSSSIARDKSEDSRNLIVAAGMLFDRAWGRPKEMPDKPETERIADMTDEELAEHTGELLIAGGMARATALAYVRRSLRLDREVGAADEGGE
jgi:hypothetical protein